MKSLRISCQLFLYHTTKYLLVEQDVCQESPFTCLEKSYNYLRSLGYK